MKRSICALVLLLALPTLSLTQEAPQSPLTRLLEAELARFPAKVGVYVKHLETGEEAGVLANEAFNSASVIKIPILIRAFQMAGEGELDLKERYEITRADLVPGSGIFQFHDLGATPTFRDLITEMIITSDNTATVIMLKRVGGMDRMNEWLAENGYDGTRFGNLADPFRPVFELLDPEFENLTTEELYGLAYAGSPLFALYEPLFAGDGQKWLERFRAITPSQFETASKAWAEDEELWIGAMTPRETGAMLEAIAQGTATSTESSDRMQAIMRAQQSGARRIPHFLTSQVAHKTGDLPPNVANDVGIVYAQSGRIIISFFTAEIEGPYAELEDRIGRVSRMIVDYFDGAGGAN